MKNFLSLFLFFIFTVFFAENLKAAEAEHGPWEDYQRLHSHYRLTKADEKQVAAGFGSDPLGFIADTDVRTYARSITDKTSDPEDTRKRMALAAWFTRHNRGADYNFIFANLDGILAQHYNRKTTVQQAYADFQKIYSTENNKPSLWTIAFEEFKDDLLIAVGQRIRTDGKSYILCFCSILFLVLLLPVFGMFLRWFFVFIVTLFRYILKILKKHTEGIKTMTETRKIFMGLAVVAEVMLVILILEKGPDFSIYRHEAYPTDGFFTFLRIVVSAALVGLFLEKFSFWMKFPLLLLAILYNPLISIRLDQEVWLFFNVLTVPALAVPWVILLRRIKKGLV